MSEDVPGRASKWPQLLAATLASIGALGHGCGLAWTSPTLPYLEDCQDNPEHPDGCTFDKEFSKEQGSWIGSSYSLGALLSGLVGGLLLVKVGRKWTLLIMGVPFIAGWILLTLTAPLDMDQIYWFYIGRALTGFGGGSFAMSVPIYVMEVAEPNIRGSLGIMMQFMLTFGLIYVNAVGSVIPWPVLTGTCIVFPVLMFVSMTFMPESPFVLLYQGKVDEARKSLQWLRGPHVGVSEEMEALKVTVAEQKSIGTIGIVALVTEAAYLKPFLLMLFIHFTQQFCGVTAIVFYLTNIFLDAGLEVDNSLYAAAIVASTQAVATGIAILVVERVGRKILLILSSSVMFVSILALGVFFHLKEREENLCTDDIIVEASTICVPEDGIDSDVIDSLSWLPLTSLIVYKFAFAIGYGPLAWMLLGEFFPREAKPISSAIVTAFNWTCSFLVTKFGVNLEEAIGTSGLYFMFSGVCAFSTFFVAFFVPETKGKSAEEMREIFAKTKRRHVWTDIEMEKEKDN